MAIGKVAVLGGGPGGHATAGDLALRGHEVHLWARNPWRAAAVFQFRQINLVGGIEGTARLADASNDLGQILKGAKLVIIPLPATAQREVAEQCAPFAEDGQVILVSSQGGLGSVEFARVFKEKGVKKDIIFAEYPGLPYSARWLDVGVVHVVYGHEYATRVFSKRIGVFPAKRTEEALEIIWEVYSGTPGAKNSLASALISRGIIHQPISTLTSLSVIDTIVFWDIIDDALTPNVRKLTVGADDERKAIESAWGFKGSEVYLPGYIAGRQTDREATDEISPEKLRAKQIKWTFKDRIDMDHRYVTEAVPYGLVLRSSAARRAGVETPVTDSLINLFSCIKGVDFYKVGRTLDSLGLRGKGVEDTNHLLHEGWD
jgi:opine dehydrogenase